MEPMTPEPVAAMDAYEMPKAAHSDEHGHEAIDQRLANYRPAEDLAISCALCAYYCADEGYCHRVAGTIRPDYVCDLFEPAILEEKAQQVAVLDGAYLVAKSDDEAQVIFGWANIAVRKDGTQTLDHHADMIDPEDLEDAAYDFVMNSRASGEDHAGETDAICVESIVFTKAKAEAMGIPDGTVPEAGWWVGFHIPDRDAYERAKTAKTMFSIEGTAIREPAEVAKREFTSEQRQAAAEQGAAMPDGSFPIRNTTDLKNAIASYGRAKDQAAAKTHIIRRARALNATDQLPKGWLD